MIQMTMLLPLASTQSWTHHECEVISKRTKDALTEKETECEACLNAHGFQKDAKILPVTNQMSPVEKDALLYEEIVQLRYMYHI